MAITEESRHRLYQRLEALLGSEEAATLMEHLPPVGWADVTTKRDLDFSVALLRSELKEELAGVRAEIAGLRHELHTELALVRVDVARELRMHLFAMLGANATVAALAFAAARLS